MYLCRGTKYFALIILIFLQTCNARKSKHYYCPTSACGNIRNISYPFRLNTDPEYCGYGLPFELACEGNQTVISLFSKKLHVQGIDYDYNTIHLVDPTLQTQDDLCSFRPMHIFFDQAYTFFRPNNAVDPIFMINCPFVVNNSSSFLEISGCRYTYLKIGKMSASEVSDGCRVEFIGLTSPPNINYTENNISLSDFHQAILNGFVLHYYVGISLTQRISFIEQIVGVLYWIRWISLYPLGHLLENIMYKLQKYGDFGQRISNSLEQLLYLMDNGSIIEQILGTSLSLLVSFMGKNIIKAKEKVELSTSNFLLQMYELKRIDWPSKGT